MSKNSKDIVICSALRTSIGKLDGNHKNFQAHDLGSSVIKEILSQSKINSEEIDEIILGQVLYGLSGQNPARQASINAGIPKEKTALNINQVCGSGLRAIVLGYQSIKLGSSNFIIAGGQESMSNSNKEEILTNGLIDAFKNYHMGVTAENVAEKFNISKDEQDKFSLLSQSKAINSIKSKKFSNEIVDNNEDEHPRYNLNIENLKKLKPVFKKNGTVTAGNSSGINDGAAGVLLTTRHLAEKKNLNIQGKIISWATCGVDPALMGLGPIPSTFRALDIADWKISDVDLFECNEAFAAQTIAVVKELKIPEEKLNVNGGAIALGHPIGATGARLTVTLVHEMIKRDNKRGLVTLCIGGGMGISMCIERD